MVTLVLILDQKVQFTPVHCINFTAFIRVTTSKSTGLGTSASLPLLF
jgi:hypothetical protein